MEELFLLISSLTYISRISLLETEWFRDIQSLLVCGYTLDLDPVARARLGMVYMSLKTFCAALPTDSPLASTWNIMQGDVNEALLQAAATMVRWKREGKGRKLQQQQQHSSYARLVC